MKVYSHASANTLGSFAFRQLSVAGHGHEAFPVPSVGSCIPTFRQLMPVENTVCDKQNTVGDRVAQPKIQVQAMTRHNC
jgi:hypothetical protein